MNIIWSAVRYMAIRGFLAGTVLGALFGTAMIFLFPWSTVLGAIIGAPVGFIVGTGCGLFAGWISRTFFHPLTHLTTYRWIMTLTTPVIAFLGAEMSFSLIFGTAIIIPSLIAAGAGIFVGESFATFYVTQQSEEKESPKQDTIYV